MSLVLTNEIKLKRISHIFRVAKTKTESYTFRLYVLKRLIHNQPVHTPGTHGHLWNDQRTENVNLHDRSSIYCKGNVKFQSAFIQ